MTAPLKDGIPISYRWLVELILLPIIFMGFAAWMTSMNTQIADIKQTIAELSAKSAASDANFSNLVPRLDRIENKLDAVISQR